MSLDVAALPDDAAFLKALLVEVDAERNVHKLLAERLRIQLARLRRMQFGSSSEKIAREIEQLELALEEVEAEAAAAVIAPVRADVARPFRRPLPEHLPRDEVVHEPACACPDCGGAMRRIGEDVTEQLDYVPASFRVIRHVRPKLGCRRCDRIVQAPLPSMPIERGRPGAGLLAHVLVAKYADHLPLYRQSDIYAREGVDLARSTMADWVGRSAALLDPLVDALARHVVAGTTLHADDTPVPVLAPGAGRTRTGRLWVYVRDERGHAGAAPPAALFRYAPDRKGERPVAHLGRFSGHVHADGYAGFNKLYVNRITEVACMAHVRRKFFDIHAANGSPVAREALDRIAALYAVEDAIRGVPADQRRSERQARAGPLHQALRAWLEATLPKLSRKSDLAIAVRYALAMAGARPLPRRWPARDRQQRRRTRPPRRCPRPQELAVRRLRQRRRARRRHLQPHRDRQAQRRRSRSLAARYHRPHRRSPSPPHRRAAPLELPPRLSRTSHRTLTNYRDRNADQPQQQALAHRR